MNARLEYQCRRCTHLFHGQHDVEAARLDDLADTVQCEIDEVRATLVHTCHYGGVGVGDLVGAREVKEART